MPQISVIIPFHNNSSSIIRCLNSVLLQTYKPHQIILIDDFSIDDSFNIVSSYISSLNINILLLKNKSNLGPGYSRNVGIENATGDFVAFLDADDTWHERKLEFQAFAINKFNIDFIGGPNYYFLDSNVNSEIISDDQFFSSLSNVSCKTLIFLNKFATSSVIVRKKINLKFLNTYYSEDYSLWLFLCTNNYSMMYSPLKLCYYHTPNLFHKGLSSNLLKMELGELNAIYNTQIIFFLKFPALLFSLFKFFKRFIIRFFRYLYSLFFL
jgi:glycosyltransferase involved in cell wall biosynthesis